MVLSFHLKFFPNYSKVVQSRYITAAYVYYRYGKLAGKGKMETGDTRIHA